MKTFRIIDPSTNSIPTGTSFISSLSPRAGRISTDLGFTPNNGDQVLLWRTNDYITSTYSSSTGWSPSEPSLKLGEGFKFVTSSPNDWLSFSPSCPSLFAVPANPVWTDTGVIITNAADTISFSAHGAWIGYGPTIYGPDGGGTSPDTFVGYSTNSGPQFSLVAFVGPNPYEDTLGTNRWGDSSYFPQLAENYGGTNGYWLVGSTGSFTTGRTGKLWLGFNDDGRSKSTNDNTGAVYGELQVLDP